MSSTKLAIDISDQIERLLENGKRGIVWGMKVDLVVVPQVVQLFISSRSNPCFPTGFINRYVSTNSYNRRLV